MTEESERTVGSLKIRAGRSEDKSRQKWIKSEIGDIFIQLVAWMKWLEDSQQLVLSALGQSQIEEKS